MLLPKIHRNSRLPRRCSQPPCRNWLVISVRVSSVSQVAAGPRGGQARPGTTPHVVTNASRASIAAARQQPELPGEDDEAGDDQPDRDDRASRRVGLASRSGITGAPRSGLRASARPTRPLAVDGVAEAPDGGARSAPVRRPAPRRAVAWWTRRLPTARPAVAGASSTPGTTYIPRRSSQSVVAAGRGGTGRRSSPLALVEGEDPPVGLVVGVDRALASARRRRPPG